MARLPDETALGSVSFRSGRPIARLDLPMASSGGEMVGQAVAGFGADVQRVAETRLQQRDTTDVIRADAHFKGRLSETMRELSTDQSYSTHSERFEAAQQKAFEESSTLIRNNRLRERWELQKQGTVEAHRDRVLAGVVRAERNQQSADIEKSLRTYSQIYADPATTDEDRSQARADMEAAIHAGRSRGLFTPGQSDRLYQAYVDGAVKMDAEVLLRTDPNRLRAELENASDPGDVLGKTADGRPIVVNPEGGISTERTITVSDPRNPDRFINIPTYYDGVQVDDDLALRMIEDAGFKDPETGRKINSYASVENAERAAQKRSEALASDPAVLSAEEALQGRSKRFSSLPPLDRVKMLDAAEDAIYKGGTLRQRIERDQVNSATVKDGIDRIAAGTLDRQWLSANRGVLTSEQYSKLSKALERDKGQTDPVKYTDLLLRVQGDPEGVLQDAVSLYSEGLLTKSDFNKIYGIASNDRDLPQWRSNIRTYLANTLKPVSVGGITDPADVRAQQEALLDFDKWVIDNPAAGFQDTRARAEDIVKEVQRSTVSAQATAMPLPAGINATPETITREQLDKAADDLSAAFNNGDIDKAQAASQARLIQQWMILLDKRNAGQ